MILNFPNHPKHVAEWLTPYVQFAAWRMRNENSLFIADLAKEFDQDNKAQQKLAYRALTAIGPAGVGIDDRILAVRELERKTESRYEKTKVLEWRGLRQAQDEGGALEARLSAIEARLTALEIKDLG